MTTHFRSGNLFLGAAILLCAFTSSLRAVEPIPGIGPVGEIETLATDLQFTEGPAADGKGNLYFSDIPAERIYKLDADKKLSVFLEPSRHTNGLMFNGEGNLVACEMDGRIVEINIETKEVKPLTAQFEEKRYNAPNDLVIDREGGIYFTDPHFRAPTPLPQGKAAFYYRATDGTVSRLADNLAAPNGLILSPDEKTLYVIVSLSKEMMAYPVTEPGKLGEGRVFCSLEQVPDAKTSSGGDGLTVDTNGNLYITSALGLQVFNPEGKPLGIIKFPEQPANCTFGGPDNRTLFVTARKSLYSVPMESTGHVFPAGRK